MAGMSKVMLAKVKGHKAKELQTSIWLRNLQGPATLKATLISEKQGMPLTVFSVEYADDLRFGQPIQIDVADQQLEGRKGAQFVQLEIDSASGGRLFAGVPMRVK
jgi:hypothetical protein